MKKKIGLFAGTFDPPSLGHLDIIKRASALCDELIIAVSLKLEKKGRELFTSAEKIEMLREMTAGIKNVSVEEFQGLVVDFAQKRGASYLVRGLRAYSDLAGEFQMALANRHLNQSSLETVFILGGEEYSHISSTLIREIGAVGGPLDRFVTPSIQKKVYQRSKELKK